MARGTTWTNNDGLEVGFGTRDSKNGNAGTVRTQGNVEVMTVTFDWDEPPVESGTAPTAKSVPIPAGAVIKGGYFSVDTAVTMTGTSPTLAFGLVDSAGTAIDADGLMAATAPAAMGASTAVALAGALVDANIGSSDGYVCISLGGTTPVLTAGDGVLVIEYIRPMPDSTPTDPITTVQGSL